MQGKTVSDWILELKRVGLESVVGGLGTDKIEDLNRLAESGLPRYDWLSIPLDEFNVGNLNLMEFLSDHQGLCVRSLPNSKGMERGFVRRNIRGYLSFEDCKEFLERNTPGNVEFWDVGLSEWVQDRFGFVLISGGRYILGELGRNLESLSHGEETPLSSFRIDRGGLGHVSDKIEWEGENEKHRRELWMAFRYITFPGGAFNPYCREGYFEGIITIEGDVKFLDFKVQGGYLS